VTQLSSAPLMSFLSALSLPFEAIEKPEHLNIGAQVDGQTVKDLDYAVVEQLIDGYGDCLTATFLLADLPELQIEPGITREVFDASKGNFISGNSYDLQLWIDKYTLLDQVMGAEEARRNVYYFFAISVRGLLAQGLDELEQAIWGEKTEARRLLIGDAKPGLQRCGPAFQIVGVSQLAGPLPPLLALPAPVTTAIQRMRTDRVQQISWDYQWVQQLTPIQLQLDGEPGGSQVEELFAAAYVQLCLLYTCDRARRLRSAAGDREIQAEYIGGQITVMISARENQPIGTALTRVAAQGFADLIDWCYRLRDEGAARDWAADRLQFTQVRIAQMLETVPVPDRLVTLIDHVPGILSALDNQWRAFIEDKFTQYLDKEHQLERVVDDVVINSGEKITALTKSLGDTLLAAVAVLIGSAIAAAFKAPFNSALFRVGVLAYGGYVLVFPGLYGLSAQVGQFLEIGKVFGHERGRFDRLLGEEQTGQIVGDRIAHARNRYWRWFGFTVLGYTIAITAAIVAAIVVPSIVT